MRGRKLSFERLEGKKLLAVHTIPDLAICSSLTSQVDDEWLIFASNTNCLTLRPLFGSGEYPYIGDLFMTDGTDGSPKLLARFEEHGWILNKEARDAIGKVYDLDGNEVMLGDEEVRLNIGFGGLRFRSAVGSRFLGQLPYPGCDGGNACVKQPSLENEPKQVGDFVVSYDSGRFFRTDAGGNEILLADFTCEAGSIAAGDINMTVLGDHVLLSITGGGELSSTSFMMDMQDDYHPARV